jgi:hypothetical protein
MSHLQVPGAAESDGEGDEAAVPRQDPQGTRLMSRVWGLGFGVWGLGDEAAVPRQDPQGTRFPNDLI